MPFHLQGRFRLQASPENPVEGTYTLDWVSPTRWREQLETSNFHEIEVGGSGKVWLLRSTKYEPLVAYRVEDALSFYGRLTFRSGEVVTSLKRTNSSKVVCLKTRLNKWTKYSMCFDTDSGILVREEDPASLATPSPVFEFRGYRPLGPHELFPREISETEKGVVSLGVDIDALSELHEIRSSLFNPPAGAVERPGCQNPAPPTGIKVTNPRYPKSARKHHVQGIVSLSLFIDAGGTVQNLTVLRTPSPDLASTTVSTIRKEWKFKPAVCDGRSVPFDVLVETAFRIR